MKKKKQNNPRPKWAKPKLSILVRSRQEESVLSYCKWPMYTFHGSGGPIYPDDCETNPPESNPCSVTNIS